MLKKSLPRQNKKLLAHSTRLSSPITNKNEKEKKFGVIEKTKY